MLELIGLISLVYLVIAGVWTSVKLKNGGTLAAALAEGILWLPWTIIQWIARGVTAIKNWSQKP